MSLAACIDALALPPGALVHRRVPKKLLLEQGAPTPADKRRIQDGIGELTWVAALKPTNIGIPAFRDDTREYLEVAVLTAELRPAAKSDRLVQLIHRAIPYPLVLFTNSGTETTLSLAHKRWSHGQAGKIVIEDLQQVPIDPGSAAPEDRAFLGALAVSGLPAGDLFSLYQGLLDRLAALEAARVTGAFRPPESAESSAATRDALDRRARLTRDLANLRATAHKEKQINRRVELNIEIKRLEAELAAMEKAL
jgi:hypothetical protein